VWLLPAYHTGGVNSATVGQICSTFFPERPQTATIIFIIEVAGFFHTGQTPGYSGPLHIQLPGYLGLRYARLLLNEFIRDFKIILFFTPKSHFCTSLLNFLQHTRCVLQRVQRNKLFLIKTGPDSKFKQKELTGTLAD